MNQSAHIRTRIFTPALAALVGLTASLAACSDDDSVPGDRGQQEVEEGDTTYTLETRVSRSDVEVGGTVDVSCYVDGTEDSARTRPVVSPDSLASLAGHQITALAIGEVAVTCGLVDGTVMDATPAVVRIHEAGDATIDTVLDRDRVVAGEVVQVTCEAKDSLGELTDVQTRFTVSPDAGPEAIQGGSLVPSRSGAFEVACEIVGGPKDTTPAALTVVAGDPTALRIDVRPQANVYDLDDEVTLEAVVTDRFGNDVDEPAAIWNIPEAVLSLGGDRYRLSEIGVHAVQAHLPAPLTQVKDQISLNVDGVGPVIELSSPVRGAVLGGEPVIRVAGRAIDDGTGLQGVRVNGAEVDVDIDGAFDVELDATFGLNLIRVEAEDDHGAVGRTTRGALWSPEKLAVPTEANPEAARRIDGMVAFLGQEALDDRDHPCRYNEAGEYRCDEVDDLATVLEVLLNNMDFGQGDPIPVIDRTFPLVGEGQQGQFNLGAADFELPPFFDLHGDIVLHWSTELAVNMRVVAEMTDLDLNTYSAAINAREGGMTTSGSVDVVDGEPGISAGVNLRVEVSVEAFVRVDSLMWGLDDVTMLMCGNDFLVEFLEGLVGAELSEPLCDGEPAASVYPSAEAVGGGFAIDSLSFEAELAAGINAEGQPDVTMEDIEVILGAGDVDLTMFEQLTFDLGEVRLLDIMEVDLGEFEIDLEVLQVLTDAILDPLANIVREETQRTIENLVDCPPDRECVVDLASVMEYFLASMAGARVIPTDALPGQSMAALAGGDPAVLTTEGVFSLLEFSDAGGVLGLSTLSTSNQEPSDEALGDLAGILARAGCDLDEDAVPGEAEADLQYAVHVDHWNQALHAAWRTGVAHRSFEAGDLPPAARTLRGDILEVVFEPVGPISASSCNAKGDVHLLAGDVKVTVTLDSPQGAQDIVGWVSLDRVSALEVERNEVLGLVLDELAGVLWEPTVVPSSLRAEAVLVGEWITSQAVPAWLQSLGETTLTALVTPSFHLGAVPGVPDGLSVRVAARDVSALDGYQMVRGAMTAQ